MEVCRICLSKQVSKNISELQNKKSNDSYSDIMLFCLGIQVTEDSKVSTKLCLKCYKKILAYHTFKTQALQNDAYLRSLESDGDNKHETFVRDSLKPDKFNNIDCLTLPGHIKQEHDFIEGVQNYESNDEFFGVEMIKYEFVPEESKDIGEPKNYIVEEYIEDQNDIAKENKHLEELNNDIAAETNDIVGVKDFAGNANATIKKRKGRKSLQTDLKCEKKANVKRHRLKQHCNICNKDVSNLKQHHQTIHDPASLPLECAHCGRRFVSASFLRQHMTVHSSDRPHECEVCKKKFRSKIVMTQHKKRMHDKEKSHLCKFCSKSFFKKYHLQRHLRSHSGEKPLDLESVNTKCEEREREMCEECGKCVWNMKEHSAMHLPPEQRTKLKCEGCDKTFLSYASRHKHFKAKHLGINQHCNICKKDFRSLKKHYLIMHEPASLPYECPSCSHRFICASSLAEHITTHTKDRPFECEVCEKKFRTKMLMVQHKRQVHDKEKTNVCPYCSKSFFQKYHLQRHLRSHTKEKPYECAECGKMLACRKTLTNHLMTHSKVKMFECTHCDKRFTNPNYVRAHMISHTKEKKHPCKYCGVKFGRSDHRKRHEFTAHEKHLATEELKTGNNKNS